MDSMGLTHFRKGQRLRWRRGSQLWQVRGHSRLPCLVPYRRRGRLLALEGVAAGPAYASHVHLGLLALAGARAQGQLLTDAGFDAFSLRQLAAQKGLVAHIPLKGGRGRRGGSWAGGTSIPLSTRCGEWWRASPGPLRPGLPVATSRRCSPPWPRSGHTWRPWPAALLLRLLLPPLLPRPPNPRHPQLAPLFARQAHQPLTGLLRHAI